MIKPCFFIILLLFIIVLILLLIFRNKFEEHFSESGSHPHQHNSRTCKYPYSNQIGGINNEDDENTNYPFPDDDECSLSNQNLDIVDVHVNNPDFNISRNIHMVNPYNPCCLRTCINDFTDVDDPTGQLRGDFTTNNGENLHYFFTSKCNECILNHWRPLTLMHEGKLCSDT